MKLILNDGNESGGDTHTTQLNGDAKVPKNQIKCTSFVIDYII